jgi:superfamily II DNA or RNA helicase
VGLETYAPETEEINNGKKKIHTLMGGMKDAAEAKRNASQNARIILITFGYGMQSLSISKMDAIVFATPRRNKMRQTLGRILRRSGDPKIRRIIIDFVDESTALRSQLSTRKGVYKEKGFSIEEEECDFSEVDLIVDKIICEAIKMGEIDEIIDESNVDDTNAEESDDELNIDELNIDE